MTSHVIVLVDDNLHWAETAAKALREEGFEVQLAEDGGEAMQLLTASSPALVILDAHLPRISGIQILRRLRERDRQTPVLMVSGDEQGLLEARAMAEGASAFLHKPMPVELLIDAVRRFLKTVGDNVAG